MKAYVDGDTDSALVVHGRPGSGKSTLVAAFCSQYDEEVSDGGSKDLFVITHIVGATGERLHVHACKSMAVSVHFESYQTVTPVLPSRGPFLRAHANSLINIGCRTPLQTPPERIHSEAYTTPTNAHKRTHANVIKCTTSSSSLISTVCCTRVLLSGVHPRREPELARHAASLLRGAAGDDWRQARGPSPYGRDSGALGRATGARLQGET